MRTTLYVRLDNRSEIEAAIEKLIAMLDDMDGDADLEPSFGSVMSGYLDECEPDSDFEPKLGRANPLGEQRVELMRGQRLARYLAAKPIP